jgi:hypothetical protein
MLQCSNRLLTRARPSAQHLSLRCCASAREASSVALQPARRKQAMGQAERQRARMGLTAQRIDVIDGQ